MDEQEPPERPSTDLTRRTLSGLSWTYLGTIVSAVLQFGMTAVLARLLTPTAFGLIAFAQVFLRFANYFAKGGITQAVVQKQNLSRDDIRAAFTLSMGLAVVFAGIVFLAAPIAGTVGQDPDLVPVLRWLTLGMLIQGFGAPGTALLRRSYRFKALSIVEVGSYVAGYVIVGAWMAFAGLGVYALVGATLTQAITSTVSRYVLVRHPLIPTRARESYRAIVQFGARVSVVGFFEFLQSNLDTLAIGRWAGTSQLGLYNRANLLADLPAYHLTNGLAQVLFPSFSAIQHDRKRLLTAYLSAVGMTSAIVLPLNAGMAVAGSEIVLVMLGDQWVGAIDVLPWLLLSSSLALIGNAAGIVTEAQAALNAKMLVAGGTAVTLGLMLLIAEGGPLAGYGAALAAASLISHVGYLLVLTRALGTSFLSLVRPYGPAALGAGAVAGAIAATRLFLLQAGTAIGVVLMAEILVGAVTLAAAFRFGPLRAFRADLAQRLVNGGVLEGRRGLLARAVTWLVGPTNTRH